MKESSYDLSRMGNWKQISVTMMEDSMKDPQNNAQKNHVVSDPWLYADWK